MAAQVRPHSGFTLIELLVAIAIAGILLSLVGPSFRGFFAKKRVEGVASELNTDIQYTRSEAVARNVAVQITFGTNCYVIHLSSATAASCTQTTKTVTPAAAEIKTVQLDAGWNTTLSPQAGTPIVFDPVRATPGAAGSIDTTSSVGGSWQVRSAVSIAGRVSTCSPNGSIKGYATTC